MNNTYLNFLLFLLLVATTIGCKSVQPQNYSFFVAGHTYGSPQRKQPGLHPPFVRDFKFLNSAKDLSFGVLTGDIVYYSRDSFWNKVDQQLSLLKTEVKFAAGNHDEAQKPIYRKRYGKSYYQFETHRDLCIVIDPGLGGWNIWDEQLEFLQKTLKKSRRYHNIFIFFHHVLWWTPDNKYKSYPPNSLDGRSPTINFWDEIVPLFVKTGKPVYCFAGDIGANRQKPAFFSDHYQNIHFLASGMGGHPNDNYILVKVNKDKSVNLFIRSLLSRNTKPLPVDQQLFSY